MYLTNPFATAICVDELKFAQVIPIYKSEDRRGCENFIPISILFIVSKLFEGEVLKQLYGYHSDNSLLSKIVSVCIDTNMRRFVEKHG